MKKKRTQKSERSVMKRAAIVGGATTKRRMLNIDEVLDTVPVARSTLFRMEKEGRFPASVYISENRRMWFEDEVAAWQSQLPNNARRSSRRK